jgi:hypothetical protein
MYGGVAGEAGQPVPLCRFCAYKMRLGTGLTLIHFEGSWNRLEVVRTNEKRQCH